MNQVAQRLPNVEKSAVEIVVYISKYLGDDERKFVVSALEKTEGIAGVEFSLMRHHLVVAKYDRDLLSSQDVLKNFNSLNLDAKLVGPI